MFISAGSIQSLEITLVEQRTPAWVASSWCLCEDDEGFLTAHGVFS
jgi:hypothetical protein